MKTSRACWIHYLRGNPRARQCPSCHNWEVFIMAGTSRPTYRRKADRCKFGNFHARRQSEVNIYFWTRPKLVVSNFMRQSLLKPNVWVHSRLSQLRHPYQGFPAAALGRPFGHPEEQRTHRRQCGDERKARTIVAQPVGEGAGDERAADLADDHDHRRQAEDHAD